MELFLYNTLSRQKEKFEPLNPPFVGLYVCGPTVYGDGHLGHARTAITFDMVYRFLTHIGYKVRYVRNITDVGHLENDADAGEDKIAKKARLEQLEPMEVVQHFTLRYRKNMEQLNVLAPSIEPTASGHIIEQIEMVQKIIDNGFGYESNGSVYFDVPKYHKSAHYGKLSGRVIEDLLANTRDLDGQNEKRSPLDFALWKKASEEHIMKWSSPWSEGFPGWHIECSAMSKKYLGEVFDIHGGGMDLLFPHHECEIAQSNGATHKDPVKYWLHCNMITIGGQKMGKSLGNYITLNEFFAGEHKLLTQKFNPMTIRFFILQAHYRSTADFSNDALLASEKGLKRLLAAASILKTLQPGQLSQVEEEIQAIESACYEAMYDDLNTPIVIANLFETVRIINSAKDGKLQISRADIDLLKKLYQNFLVNILGIEDSFEEAQGSNDKLDGVMQLMLNLRAQAKSNKDFATADRIRDELLKMNFVIKDSKEGSTWTIE